MANDDLLQVFRIEVGEALEALNSLLLRAEMAASDDPATREMLVEMNRVAHSMKGAARAVGMRIIEEVAHEMEDIFGAAMESQLTLSPEVSDALYDGLDVIQNEMDGDPIAEETLATVLDNLKGLMTSATGRDANTNSTDESTTATTTIETPTVITPPQDALPPQDNRLPDTTANPDDTNTTEPRANRSTDKRDTLTIRSIESQTVSLRPVEETVRITVSKLDRLMAEATELLVARMHGDEHQRTLDDLRYDLTRWQREWRSVRTSYIRLVRRLQDDRDGRGGVGGTAAMPELNVLFKFLESNQRYLTEMNRRLAGLYQTVAQDNLHLTTLSDQLQGEISGMRLIPFDSTIGSFQRVVRDLARDMNKQVVLDLSGTYIEIDKTVLDALRDPILHVLRNALDHGIELPDDRERMGKPRVGHVALTIEQRGNEIVLRVGDDGRGIDSDKLRRSIIKHGLLSEAEVAALPDEEIQFYVFHPGLSTNTEVTAVSGRGYGMDIVRDRVESLRGRVSIESQRGSGTIITMRVPVSLTRIRTILLMVGGQQFAIPSEVVVRMETAARDEVFTAEGQDMIVINNQPLPLVPLAAVLGRQPAQEQRDDIPILILEAANRRIAFEVDSLSSEQELVLKPLGREIARARYVSGAALLGNSDIVIVLDSNDLVRAASGLRLPQRRSTPLIARATRQRRQRALVVDDSITTRTLEKNILETAGFEVYVAIDGVEALSLLNEIEVDVVISDVEMPNMNGLQLAQHIKQSPDLRDTPVILLTSLSKPEQREAGLRAGADAYLVKSRFDQGELLQTIQSVL